MQWERNALNSLSLRSTDPVSKTKDSGCDMRTCRVSPSLRVSSYGRHLGYHLDIPHVLYAGCSCHCGQSARWMPLPSTKQIMRIVRVSIKTWCGEAGKMPPDGIKRKPTVICIVSYERLLEDICLYSGNDRNSPVQNRYYMVKLDVQR